MSTHKSESDSDVLQQQFYTIQDPMLPAIIQDLPQVMSTIGIYNNRMKELRLSLQPTIAALSQVIDDDDSPLPEEHDVTNGISFLQLRTQLLLQYNMNLLQYMTLRAEGRTIEGHPCIKRLIHLRVIMEKMKPIMSQLQYQIDQTLQQSSSTASPASTKGSASTAKTQAEQFTATTPLTREQLYEQKRQETLERKQQLKEHQEDSTKELDNEMNQLNKRTKFQSVDDLQDIAMNNMGNAGDDFASQYHLREKRSQEQHEMTEKIRDKASYSTLVRQLREDLSERPMEESTSGLGLYKMRSKEQRERKEFEEENYHRLQDNKQDRNKQRRLQRLQGMDDIDEVADFRALYVNENKLRDKAAREKAMREFEAAEQHEQLMETIGKNVKKQYDQSQQHANKRKAPPSRR